MANDQNKSGNGNPPNGLADPDSILSKIQQREREAGRQTVREIQLGSTLEPKEVELRDWKSVNGVAAGSPAEKIVQENIDRLQNSLNKSYSSIDVGERSRRERSERVLTRDIERQYGASAIRGETIRSSTSTQNVAAGAGMVDVPYSQLEARRSTSEMNIAGYTRQAVEHAQGMYSNEGTANPQKVAAITELEKKIRAEQNSLGGVEAGLRYQKSLGMDPQSRLENVGRLARNARSQQNEFQTAEEIRSTGGVTVTGKNGESQFIKAGAEASAMLPEKTKAVVDALDALSKAAKAGTTDLTKLSEAVETASAEQEKVAAASGGGSTGSQRLAAMAGGFQAAAAATQALFVDQRLQQAGNITGLANIENQKYESYRKASAGDVMSQMQLGQYAAAEGFGSELSTGALLKVGAQTLGGAAQTGAGMAQVGEGGGEKFNPLTYALGTNSGATQEVVQGGLNAVQGAAQTGVSAADAIRHLSTTQARIQGVNGYMQATQALQHVGAEQLQGFRDFGTGLGATARSLGGGGAAFINRSMEFAKGEPNNIGGQDSALTRARLGPEEFNKMSQMGATSMGSVFSTNQVFAARNLERSGFGTKEENMQRMSALAQAGSNNPQAGLGSILESAVSKGMDSSKAISQLVDHSAAMAASSLGRAMGMDTAGASASMITALMDPNARNKEAAEQRAADMQGQIKDISNNRDVSFAGMVNTSRISKLTGLGGLDAIAAQGMDIETLKTMKGKSATEQQAAYMEQGINVPKEKAAEITDKLLFAKSISLAEGKGVGFALPGADAEAIAKKAKDAAASGKALNFKDLTTAEQTYLGHTANLSGGAMKTGSDVLRAIESVYAGPSAKDQNKAGAAMAGKGGSKEQQTMDDLLTQSAKQQAAASAEATKTFKTARETFSELTKMAKSIEKLTDTGYEGKAKTAAADSAATFGDAAAKIDMGGDKILAAARILASKAGLGSDKNDIHVPDALKKMVPGQKSGSNPRGQSH